MFKKGDRVRIRPTSYFYGINERNNPAEVDGTVIKTPKDGVETYDYKVAWDTGGAAYYFESDLKKCILDNPLNRKLYPNRIEKGGYLIQKTAAKLNEGTVTTNSSEEV